MPEPNANHVIIEHDKQIIQLSFTHEKTVLHIDYPEKLDTFRAITSEACGIILKHLGITTLSRVGNRYQYIYGIGANEAEALLTETGLITVPDKIASLGESVSWPHIRFTIHRGDISIKTQVGYFERQYQLPVLPLGARIDTSEMIFRGVSVDLDFFTVKAVDLGVFDVNEFISTKERSSRKMIDTFFA